MTDRDEEVECSARGCVLGLASKLPIPRWQFSLHRLLTGEWQASFVDEADSRSGHEIRDTPQEAVRAAADAARSRPTHEQQTEVEE